MGKMTVLQMTESILNDMDSDEVNSINDTVEASQVASILEDTFYEITNDRKWPTHRKLMQLDPTTTSTPSHMRIPTATDITKIDWIKYNVIESGGSKDEYREIYYMQPDDFIHRLISRDSSASTVDSITNISDGVTLLIINDTAPTYYTSFDDDYIVFDSYDSGVDSNLQKSKTLCYAVVEPTFSRTDLGVPDIPSKAFPYFLAEAKSTCFASIKQSANAKEEQKSKRQRSYLSRNKHKIDGGIKYPNYGRLGRRG